MSAIYKELKIMYARELEQLRPELTGLNLDEGVSTIDFPFKFTAQNTRLM